MSSSEGPFGDDPFVKKPRAEQPGQPGPQHGPAAGQSGYSGYPPPYPPGPGYPGYPPAQGYPPPAYGPPPNHLGWAITAIVFFWPLAIASFINYAKIDSLWYRGDYAGAQRASEATKRYGVIALCIGLGLIVLWLVFAVALVAGTSHSFNSCVSPTGSC